MSFSAFSIVALQGSWRMQPKVSFVSRPPVCPTILSVPSSQIRSPSLTSAPSSPSQVPVKVGEPVVQHSCGAFRPVHCAFVARLAVTFTTLVGHSLQEPSPASSQHGNGLPGAMHRLLTATPPSEARAQDRSSASERALVNAIPQDVEVDAVPTTRVASSIGAQLKSLTRTPGAHSSRNGLHRSHAVGIPDVLAARPERDRGQVLRRVVIDQGERAVPREAIRVPLLDRCEPRDLCLERKPEERA